MMISLVELQSRNILRMVAFQEIFLLPLSVLMIFAGSHTHAQCSFAHNSLPGKTSLAIPFLYYRFLGLRYTSRRNPYCRTMCHELRLSMEAVAYSSKCPAWAKNVIYKVWLIMSSSVPAGKFSSGIPVLP